MKLESVLRILVVLLCWLALPGPATAAQKQETTRAEPAVQWVTLTGYTRAAVFLDLDTEFAGKVLAVRADVGENIPEDGVFARLDTTFIKLDLEALTADIEKLETRLAYYSKEESRYRKLVAKGNTDQSTYDKFQWEMDEAASELRSQKVKKARLEEELERYTLRVPPGYTVIERTIEPGEWLKAGAPVGKFGDYSTLEIPFSLDPQEYRRLQSLPELRVTVYPVSPGRSAPQTLKAAINNISPAFDPETRKIQVDLAITPKNIAKRGGLRTELRLSLPDRAGSVLLPEKFVGRKYEENFVIRADGQQIPVVVLGKAAGGKLRVSAAQVRPGDSFRLPQGNTRSQAPDERNTPAQKN